MMDITFVVPIYNAEKYLSECLESLLKQNVDKEILCINDGSTDNSLKILQEYSEKYPEIKIINKKNEGVSKARNLGIDEARGRYLWFVDADDLLLVNNLSKLIELADKYQLDLVRGMVEYRDSYGKKTLFYPVSDNVYQQFLKKNMYAEPLSNTQYLLSSISKGFVPKIWSGFYRVGYLRENNCYFPNIELNNAEDEYFEILILSTSLNIKIFEVSIPFYSYRYNELGSSKSKLNQFKGSILSFQLILELCNELENKFSSLYNISEDICISQLLWCVRFIALRLNFIACCEIYMKLNVREQKKIRGLISKTNMQYIEEFKYILFSNGDNVKYYFSKINLFLEYINKVKCVLSSLDGEMLSTEVD